MCGVSLLTTVVLLAILLPFILKDEATQPAVVETEQKDTAIHDGLEYAVVNLSVCNLRQTPNFTAEMSTQALMGMPVKVLAFNTWYQIQTPDDYTGWVHPVGIWRMTKDEYDDWNEAEKVTITQHFGTVYAEANDASQTVSDVVAGNRLKLKGKSGNYYQVEFPDGRQGFVSDKIAQPLTEWRKQLKQDASSLIETAYTMMGFPYIWAGTSSKGMDCSGYIRNIYYMHDMIIPRDASQMVKVGEHIDIAADYSNIVPGDLIFFGRKATPERKEGVSHVGMYLGNGRFIHSQGNVHVSSLLPDDELFDEMNLNRLLYAVRILPYINKEAGLNTTDRNPYYN
ncbi:MAG: C40 family peptidase [Bacteroidaceae bacterium]|nr:C40 family peptidase [Bacteroidaceae bacterium]